MINRMVNGWEAKNARSRDRFSKRVVIPSRADGEGPHSRTLLHTIKNHA